MATKDGTNRLLKAGTATALVLIVGWLTAPRLSHWYSVRLADRLTMRIAAAEDVEVKVLLHQLASLGEPALESLVVGAASQREVVSSLSRQIIDEKLAAWEFSTKAGFVGSHAQQLNDTAAVLATALAVHAKELGPAGKQWAEQLAMRLIDLAGSLPGRQTQIVLESCDRVLSAVPPRGPRFRTVTSFAENLPPPMPRELKSPQPAIEPLTRASDGALDILARLKPGDNLEFRNRLTRVESLPEKLPRAVASPSELHWSSSGKKVSDTPPPFATAPLPTIPKSTAQPNAGVNSSVVDVPNPREMEELEQELRQYTTDKLLIRLRKARYFEAGLLRRVLGKRGYSEAEVSLMLRLQSPDVAERLQLVEDASTLSATATRRLLRRLLEDDHGDVRLRALTALATTNSPEIVEVARELALQDDDPRVAELASRLLRPTR